MMVWNIKWMREERGQKMLKVFKGRNGETEAEM